MGNLYRPYFFCWNISNFIIKMINVCVSWDTPLPFLKGEGVNFNYLPWRRGSEKNREWKYGARACLLKMGGGEGLALFLFNIFRGYQLEILEITLQSHHQLQEAADISQHQQPLSSASCSWWRLCYMLKHTCRQVLVLQSWCLMHPADDFNKLLYSLQNCVMHLQKKHFFLPP